MPAVTAPRPPIVETIDSRIETSMMSPRPVSRARRSAAADATAAYVPATQSPSRPPAWIGSSPGQPLPPIEPHNAWSRNSLLRSPASTYGPVVPNGVTLTTIADELSDRAALTSASVRPGVSSTMIRSASGSRSNEANCSSGGKTTDPLPAARNPKRGPASGVRNSPAAPPVRARRGSPSGGSAVTTFAPASRSILPQYAPERLLESSSTWSPRKGKDVDT